MWSSSNQRIKALMSARGREKERLTRPIHVHRADLTLRIRSDDGGTVEIPARALLNDFTQAGFCAYSEATLPPNVELTIEIQHPKQFTLTGKVVWCQYQPSSSHVITAQAYQYRVGFALLWKDAAAEAEFKKFCDELSGLYVNKKGLFVEEIVAGFAPATSAVSTAPAGGETPVPAPTDAAFEEALAAETMAAKTPEAASSEAAPAETDKAAA